MINNIKVANHFEACKANMPETREINKSSLNEVTENKNMSSEVGQQNRDCGEHCPKEGNHGHWEGERGEGRWIPDPDYIPQKANPEGATWEEILKDHELTGVVFEKGDLNLEEISKGTVQIDEIGVNRSDNFDKADIELARQRGCSPEEVAEWRKENNYTWHEKSDGHTMQKVPSIIHGNISHSGGVAEAKRKEAA